jgi:hypothetical protein
MPESKSVSSSHNLRSIDDVRRVFHDLLYNSNNSIVNGFFSIIEQRVHVSRDQFTYAIVGLFAIYMVVGYFAQLLCNAIAFAYPAYASIQVCIVTISQYFSIPQNFYKC